MLFFSPWTFLNLLFNWGETIWFPFQSRALSTKANKELGWDSITTFEVGIKKTIEWYLSKEGSNWLNECMAQNAEWLKKNYENRK